MPNKLSVALGQYSDKGRKESNQDFHGAFIPAQSLLDTKGMAIVLADGISSSPVSHIASETAVKSFLDDYFCTAETWQVKKSVQCVLFATNSWLYSQTRQSQYRYEKDRGYVCTFTALVLKARTAHLFHVGDARIYRVNDGAVEQLTKDHRLWLSQEEHYLSRALGMDEHLEIDYAAHPIAVGDVFWLATDGAYEYVSADFVIAAITANSHALDVAAKAIVDEALRNGSTDNLTVQLVRVETLADEGADEVQQQLEQLPLPPMFEPRMVVDGYRIVRGLHSSSRSHVFLAQDEESNQPLVLKIPSVDLRNDKAYLERFLLEDWIARRIQSPYVIRPGPQARQRSCLYITTEYLQGQTLRQWMLDHPAPDIETVRNIVEQIAKGLQAMHRLEMLHQDLRPENIMLDGIGSVKILDFGSTRVAGLVETALPDQFEALLGTAQYTAPEYFLGESGSPRSDLFSLGVIAYEMLTGKLPFGAEVAKTRTQAQQNRLHYGSALDATRAIPRWVDGVLKKAVQPDPNVRYAELSEFVYDLRHPGKAFLAQTNQPLLERNPVAFWQGVSLLLALVMAVLLYHGHG